MSRSGYSDDIEDMWALIRWRGAVNSSIRGARGQAFLRELLTALDEMPVKQLAAHSFVVEDGKYCTLGVMGAKRGLDLQKYLGEDRDDWSSSVDAIGVGNELGIARALAKEIMYENDEGGHWEETPERRWQRVRQWVADQIQEKRP